MEITESASLSKAHKSVSLFTSDLCKKFGTNRDENYICSSLSVHVALSKIDFNKHLIELGMVEAFDAGLADFNKICNKGLFIQKVLQKAYIKVDELGCEAAAVTAVLCVEMCLQISLTNITIAVDRPFLFRIMDDKFKIPLFIGSVVDPR